MTCARCNGFMVCERDETHWMNWRCINCGEHFDNTVLNNRWLYHELKLLEDELNNLCIAPPSP